MSHALSIRDTALPLAVGDLSSYISAAHTVPMLTAEEEYSLARQLRTRDSLEAAQRLILSHLRFVISIARDYRNYGLPMADLIQEGNIGLMVAVKRFDPEQGVRLAAYAVHWIRAKIYDYVLKNWRIVRVVTTKAQRKLFFNLHKMKKRLGWFNREQVESVAEELGVTPEDVVEMESRLAGRDELFDPWSHGDENEPGRGHSMEYLADLREEPAQRTEEEQYQERMQARVRSAMAELDERSQSILQRRWLDEPKATLKELSEEFGVSLERIRQIESAALKKLRSRVEAIH